MEKPKPAAPPQPLVGITYNLKKNGVSALPDDQAEYDDLSTILAIKKALEEIHCRVVLLEATGDLPQKLIAQKPDIVFNIAEGIGGRGREAQVPAILNLYGIPFTGSDETTLAVALDKALTKRLLATYHIKTPKYQVAGVHRAITAGRFSYPVIVKPNAEGSSKGISDFSLATDAGELRRVLSKKLELYQQDMLVEEYIAGREFTVGILGNGETLRVFPPMEIIYKDRNNPFQIYSFDVKKNYKEHLRYKCPPELDLDTQTEIIKTARRIYEVLSCRDCARIDFRLSPAGALYFIEINPLPGLAPGYSDFPMLAEFCGMDYHSLVQSILRSALERYRLNLL
jgi:D-alanine-D-alanine ligase